MGELTEREKSRQRLLTQDLLFLCKIKQIFKMLVTFSSHSSSSGLPLYTTPSYQVTYSEYKLNALNQPLKGVFLYLGRERPSILIGNRPSIKRALNTSKTEKTQDWWVKRSGFKSCLHHLLAEPRQGGPHLSGPVSPSLKPGLGLVRDTDTNLMARTGK